MLVEVSKRVWHILEMNELGKTKSGRDESLVDLMVASVMHGRPQKENQSDGQDRWYFPRNKQVFDIILLRKVIQITNKKYGVKLDGHNFSLWEIRLKGTIRLLKV